jgi:hypothetical protein
MSLSMSAWAESPPAFPWLYPYREDAQSTRLGAPIFRPFVQISLANGDRSTSQLTGLVDTGADAVLASNLLTVELGVDLADNEGESQHAVGGRTLTARYKTIAMRLHPGDGVQDVYLEWPVRVGFVEDWHSDGLVLLGSVGFLDRFTVTASRFAQAVAIEERDAFDERFGVVGAG